MFSSLPMEVTATRYIICAEFYETTLNVILDMDGWDAWDHLSNNLDKTFNTAKVSSYIFFESGFCMHAVLAIAVKTVSYVWTILRIERTEQKCSSNCIIVDCKPSREL